MRVTFVIPGVGLSGGIRVVAIYAERLKRRGHDVFIVSVPKVPSLGQRCKHLLRGRGWPGRWKPAPSHFDGVDVKVHVIHRRRGVIDSDLPDADVVVATWWETAEWVAALSPAKGVKVHFMQDYEVWGGPRERVDSACQFPMPKIIIAGWVGKLLQDRFCVDTFTLIPNSVDTNMFHAPPRGKQCRPTVGMVYTTFFNKGCDISMRAYELARREVPDLKLVAFGGQPTNDLPLPDSCEFSYHVPNDRLKDIYSRCDAWLFGTRIEGFGLPILEAMACRTPVIGTPAGAAPELLAGGGGRLVKAEDPEDMARAIETICTLPENAWMEMSRAAFKTASSYTWDDATDRFERALHTAINRARRGEVSGGGAESRPAVASKSMPGIR